MLSGDARRTVDLRVLGDPRVTNLWDESKMAGRWFAENVDHEEASPLSLLIFSHDFAPSAW